MASAQQRSPTTIFGALSLAGNYEFYFLGLAEPLLRAVAEQGYDTPSPHSATKRSRRYWLAVI